MRFFNFSVGQNINDFACDDNGWVYDIKQYSKFCIASLVTPIQKEVTHSKGTTVRYLKHNVFCVGLMKDNSSFYGIAFFDCIVRLLIVSLIAFGVGYASESIVAGIIWAFLFYLLISFLSVSDDSLLFSKIKRKFQL